jgi:hypothetical protein
VLAMKPIQIEVIAPVQESWGLCTACELVMSKADVGGSDPDRALAEYPAEWQEEFRQLGDWVFELAERYRGQVRIVVIDPRSPRGLLKSARHRVRRTPTWIVDGKRRVAGWDREALERAVLEAIGRQAPVPDGQP